ncbi:MAG: hypothetical protein ABSF18_07835 [Gammaproteobacteria bacterium]|jgi:hypothetical protein
MSEKIPLQQLLRQKTEFQDVKDPSLVEGRKRALHQAETSPEAPSAKRMKVEEGVSREVTKADLEAMGMNYVKSAQEAGEAAPESAARIIRLLKAVEQQAVESPATGAVLATQFDKGNKSTTPAQPVGGVTPPAGPSVG